MEESSKLVRLSLAARRSWPIQFGTVVMAMALAVLPHVGYAAKPPAKPQPKADASASRFVTVDAVEAQPRARFTSTSNKGTGSPQPHGNSASDADAPKVHADAVALDAGGGASAASGSVSTAEPDADNPRPPIGGGMKSMAPGARSTSTGNDQMATAMRPWEQDGVRKRVAAQTGIPPASEPRDTGAATDPRGSATDAAYVAMDAVPARPFRRAAAPLATDPPTHSVVVAAATSVPALWARLQEEAPPPPGQEAASSPSPSDQIPGLEPIGPGTERAPATGPGGRSTDIGSEQTRLGEEPVDRSLQFLRRQTVLLRPGQCQFDVGVSYLINEADFPVLLVGPPDDVAETRVKQRLLVVPFEWRYGITSRLQGFISAPVGWSNTEITFAGIDEFDNTGGIGDTTVGLTAHLQERWGYCPDIIGTIYFTAPTGNPSFPLVPLVPQSQLGQGYWAIGGNLLFIHTLDPVVVFYGLGVRHRFENDFNTELLGNITVEPGFETNYQFGVAFAANERVTLSVSFFGAYLTDDYVEDVRAPGTALEPLTLRFAATIAQCTRIMEPFAEIGMTDDAPSARVGIVWTY